MTFNIRNVCFLCSEDFLEDDHSVHNSTENIRGPCSRFHEENAFVICHILEIPHWQSVTTRSKFQDTLFCHQCMDKIKEIRCLLQDLAELEQMVLNRKVEVETQLRQSWEKRRNMNIDDPVDHFRNEIVTELSSTKLLSTLTKVRENRIGRRFSSSSKEIPKSEEAEAKFISSSVAEAYLPQREATIRTRNRFLTTTVPTTDTVEEETEDSNPRRVTELIFSDGQGSSGLPRYIPINEGRMETEITENIVGSSITNEFQDVEEPEFVNTSSEYGYAAEVCDVKYDPLSSEYEEQITSGTDHPSASNSVTVTDGPNIYVHESELHLPSNIQFTTGTGSANKGISSVGYTSYRELKQPYKPVSESDSLAITIPLGKSASGFSSPPEKSRRISSNPSIQVPRSSSRNKETPLASTQIGIDHGQDGNRKGQVIDKRKLLRNTDSVFQQNDRARTQCARKRGSTILKLTEEFVIKTGGVAYLKLQYNSIRGKVFQWKYGEDFKLSGTFDGTP